MFVSSPSRRLAMRRGICFKSTFSAYASSFKGRTFVGFAALFTTCISVSIWIAAPCFASQLQTRNVAASDFSDPTELKPISPIPVTRILLYSSGLAQVLHEGEVEDNVLMELPFSGHDVDDVLKSLILDDAKGTKQSIVYSPTPDREAIAAKEHEDPLSFAQLLQKYRGERINLKSDDKTLSGHILGVENRPLKQEMVETLLLMTESGIQTVPISGLSELNFESTALKQEFELAFAGLVKGRDATRRRVGLRFEGKGKRRVRFSYVVDAPIWRVTYRLALKEKTSRLQSWVHLDNVFGYDWKEIEIVLRSGRPAAFHADLFAPILAERKSVGTSVFDMPSDVTLVMQWFGFDPPMRFGTRHSSNLSMIASEEESNENKNRNGGLGMGGMGGGGMGSGGFGGAAKNVNEDQTIDHSRVIKQASTFDSRLGLLELKLKQRVSLGAGKSAAIPLWEEEFPSVSMGLASGYSLLSNRKFDSVHSIIDIENNRDLPLLTAPVAIYEEGNFVGDSKIEATPPKEKARILYAIDAGVQIETGSKPKEIRLKTFQHLGLESWLARRERTAKVLISIANQHQKTKLIQLDFEVPFKAMIKPEMEMISPTLARLTQSVEANSKKDLEFEVVYLDDERMNTDDLLSNRELIEEAKKLLNEAHLSRLNKLIELKARRDAITKTEQHLSAKQKSILTDQARWSDLVKKLEHSVEARNKYIALITEAEDKFAALGLELAKTLQEREALQRQWNEVLEIKPLDD